LGFKKAKSYHICVIITGWALLLVFLLGVGELEEWRGGIWYVLIAFIHLKHIVFVMQNKDPKLLDPELKKISLSSFVVALFMILSVTV
jgi:1,4-dihydroxy-2-naphthoate octaprenyltransferase